MTLTPGHLLGPYRIDALLGMGGMGEVYRARDSRLGRDAALKVISPKLLGNAALRRRFETEARAASALNHPAIVTVYDVGESDGISWIAMEWVEGRTLRERLTEEGALPVGQVVSIGRQIAEGLAAAHAKRVVHRDLKPDNVMLVADGRAKILDFGLARHTAVDERSASQADTFGGSSDERTFEGTILGTIGYMSPEQASGRPVDFRSDQFALGVLLYEMLAGRRAFARPSTVETLAAILRDDPVPLSSIRAGIPEALEQLITRCLAKPPESRFGSTGEIAMILQSIGSGASVGQSHSDFANLATEIRDPGSVAAQPVPRRGRLAALALAGILTLTLAPLAWNRFRVASDTIDSLAVLPFENVSRDSNADYLSDGLTESLIDQMSRVPSLKVMARSTVARFKRTADPQSVGRQLGVGAVLVGTVSKRNGQLVISTELVESSSGARLWGQTYDRPETDLLRVQDSIALEIVDGLRLQLSPQEQERIVAHGTKNPEAYELFLKARALFAHDTEEDDLEARRLLLLAIEKDPNFVEAYDRVAVLYVRRAGNGYAPPSEAWARAAEYANKALQLNPGHFGARASLTGRHFLHDWDWALAEREMLALSNDPRFLQGTAYHGAAMYYWATGRPEESIAVMEKGLRDDPHNMESRVMLADFLSEAGRQAESIAQYKTIIAAEPNDPRARFGLANALKRRGEIAAAIDTLRQAYELTGEHVGIGKLAQARTLEDYEEAERAVARDRLEHLEELATERYVSPADLARLQAKVGDRERAFANLEAALAERAPGLVFLKVDRAWDTIRHDARFAKIVQRVGIP